MANHHLRNRELSLKAKGLLSLMLSLPEDWDYTTKGLSCICKDGVDSICATIKELEKAGYVKRRRLRDAQGRLSDLEYTILEKPEPLPSPPESPQRENPVVVKPDVVEPDVDNPELGKPHTENPAQLSIQEVNKQESITNLWETLTYRVCEIKIIDPHDVTEILIQPRRELLTLLTCHPYASGGKQRYVVYCERVESSPVSIP